MSFHHQKIDFPVGPLHLVADRDALHVVTFESMWPHFKKKFETLEESGSPLIDKAKRQLIDYFSGKRRNFDLPLKLGGTEFQNRVWRSLEKIPFGKTSTYKQQALTVKSPKAVRAVGGANGLNPFCIVLPCHRVIGSDGALTGFAGGLKAKMFLLNFEKTVTPRQR
jgi:methylated-DNA-[protein]-cysteine S-methyltransferase